MDLKYLEMTYIENVEYQAVSIFNATKTPRQDLTKSLGSFQVSHGGQGADSHVLRQRAVLLASGRVDFAASEKMAKALRMLNAFGLGSVLPEGATGNELHRLRQLS